MESPEKDSSAGVTRGQHVVYTLPPDRAHIPQFMAPLVAKIDRAVSDPQVIVVTPDAELALDIVSVSNVQENPVWLLPVTNGKRAARLLHARPAQLVAGDARALLDLVRSASLKLDAIKGIVVAWADHIFDAGDGEALDALFGELPKEAGAARVVVVERMTPEVESLLERQLRRARRVELADAEGETGAVSVIVTSPAGRTRALRRLLDELDPSRALVIAASDDTQLEAERAVNALGHGGESASVARDATNATGHDLVVLYGLPASRVTLVAVAAAQAGRVVALVEARQVPALRRMAASVVPFVFPDAARAARGRDDQIRDELRRELASGAPTRELLALEPLLAEYEGTEIAAAALRLLERERAQMRATSAAVQPTASTPAEGGFVKVFLTVGSRDGVLPGDLVGSISGESDIRSSKLGKIEIREGFSLVEVASDEAEKVIAAMNGATLKGRKLAARLDRDASEGTGSRDRAGAPPRGRPPRGDDRAPRDRGAPRSGASRPDAPRDDRGRGGARGDRPAGRGGPPRDRDFKPRGDRGPRSRQPRDEAVGPRRDKETLPPEREQWSTRGDAMRNAKRPRGVDPTTPPEGGREE